MANFRTGREAAIEASKASGGTKFSKLEYFSIKEASDPKRYVRFLTDIEPGSAAPGVISTTMHPSMPTRSAPAGFKGQWPSRMGAVCRMDNDHGNRTFPQFADCYHCITPDAEGKPRKKNERTWGLGILRVEDGRDANGALRLKDQTRLVTVEENGVKVEKEEIFYVVFNMAWSNFWTTLDDFFQVNGTILDRDFIVTRKGFTMNDTDYGIVPMDPVYTNLPDHQQPVRVDFRDAEIRAFYPDIPNLGEFVEHNASDDFYARFFDVRLPQPSFGTGDREQTNQGAANVQTPSGDVSSADLASIAARVQSIPGMQGIQGYGANSAPVPAGTDAPAQAATATVGLGLSSAPLS